MYRLRIPCLHIKNSRHKQNQSTAGSVVFTAWRIMQPLVEVNVYVVDTAKLLCCKLLYCRTTKSCCKSFTMPCCKIHYFVWRMGHVIWLFSFSKYSNSMLTLFPLVSKLSSMRYLNNGDINKHEHVGQGLASYFVQQLWDNFFTAAFLFLQQHNFEFQQTLQAFYWTVNMHIANCTDVSNLTKTILSLCTLCLRQSVFHILVYKC